MQRFGVRTFWAQRRVCRRLGVPSLRPGPGTITGVALGRATELEPLNAIRHLPVGQSNGWYVWRGGQIPQDDDEFFSPVHIEHAKDHFPGLLPYLALPPGFGVILAPGYEDVWQDQGLLDP
ncbi:immunity protein Imm33 domain-containing protein [Winogradskya consettensis]